MGWMKKGLAVAAFIGIVGLTGKASFEMGKVRGAAESDSRNVPQLTDAEQMKLLNETATNLAIERDDLLRQRNELKARVLKLENEIVGRWEKLLPTGSNVRCINGQIILKKDDVLTSLGACK